MERGVAVSNALMNLFPAIENVGPSHRSWIGILYSIFFSLGFAFVPVFAYACRNWVDLQIIMAAPPVILLLTVW